MLALWNEDVEETDGVQVALDGVALAVVVGLSVDELPGVNGGTINGLPAGQRVFELTSLTDGTSLTGTIEVVDVQPFDDPTVSCRAGEIDGEGTCRMDVDIDSRHPRCCNSRSAVDGQRRTGTSDARPGALRPWRRRGG